MRDRLVWYRWSTSQAGTAQQSPEYQSGGPRQSAFACRGVSERRDVQQISSSSCSTAKNNGTSHDGAGPLCLNLRRNGLRTPWGYYALHEPYQLTREEYCTGA